MTNLPKLELSPANIRARLFRGAVWITAARAISNVLGLLSTLALAKLLVATDFGLIALGTTFLSIITALTEIPLTEALVQHKNPTNDHFHTAFTFTALRALVVSSLFASLSWPVAVLYKDHRLINVMLALAFGMLLNGLANPRSIMLTKQLIFWQQFMLQVAQRLASLTFSVLIAFIYHSYWALVIGTLSGQVVGVAVSYLVLPFRPRFCLRHARELTSFSIWLTFSQMINTLNWRVDQFLIGTFLSKEQLGYYVVGDNLAAIPSREATAPLTATLFPALARLSDDKHRLATAYTSAQSLTSTVALPVGVGVALIADPLVRLVLGEKWLPVVFVIQGLSWVFALNTLGSLAQPLAMAAGQTALLFKRDLQYFVFRVPFIFIGMHFDGLAGIVYARAFTSTIGLILNTTVVTKITGLTFMKQLAANVRSLLSSLLMTAAVFYISTYFQPGYTAWHNLKSCVILGLSGLGVYVTSTAILWSLYGYPSGPEREILNLTNKMFVKLSSRNRDRS